MKKTIWVKLILFMFFFSCGKVGDSNGSSSGGQEKADPKDSLIGKVLPDWQEGELDIHAINTGRGECTFFIFPDGTTMLVDAAGSLISPDNSIPPPPQKPNTSISSGQAIVNYIKHFMPKNKDGLDYILLSHFHPDHMGGYNASLPENPEGDFKLSGVTEVGAKIPFGLIVDRGYPDYNYPTDLTTTNSFTDTQLAEMIKNYIKFIMWAKVTYNAKAEQFNVGSDDQFVLKKDPSEYSNFEIRNIVSNGVVWTGEGNGSVNTYPDDKNVVMASQPSGNMFSNGFELTYGKFNYFSAGDLQYNGKTAYPWKDIETSVSKVMTSVDVMKADHHGTSNTNGAALVNKLSPQAVLVNVWRDVQPNPATIERFYAANQSGNIFLTNLSEANKQRLGDYAARLKSTNGHIVVRVAPGGSEYTIYVLDDTNEKYQIKSIFGHYESK